MFKNNFGGKPRITKDGYKDYHLKAETGYLKSKMQEDQEVDKKKMTFNFFIEPNFPNWKLSLRVPGFGSFGLMRIAIFLKEELIWEGKGFLYFGISAFRLPKSKALQPGKKYKVMISRWI